MSSILLETDMPLPMFVQGKVRDTYDLGNQLLIVVTDRISAFDVVLPCGIPYKGTVLNQLSAFWFNKTRHIISNHKLEVMDDLRRLDTYIPITERFPYPRYLLGRSMIVKKVKRLDVECIARGYISGSAWAEYRESGTVNGMKMPEGLVESQELPEPIFTPTTKAKKGHDEPITMEQLKKQVGVALAEQMAHKTLELYSFAREYALGKGFIIADTKVEFGLDNGKLILIDELLTPDSSRFWDTETYEEGRPQDSYDKQPVRDWLASTGWNKKPPAPELPPEVIESTSQRYRKAYEQLTGRKFAWEA